LLQRGWLSSSDEIPSQMCWYARERAVAKVGCVAVAEPPFLISSLVARFVDRLAGLSAAEWESIQLEITEGGTEVEMLEASRNAAVALAVRDLISREQFEFLYSPFLLAIPVESLEAAPELD
jgi:hypothetical protein